MNEDARSFLNRHLLGDLTLWALLGANLLNLALALALGFNAATQVWVYVIQGIIVGAFNFMRMRRMRPAESLLKRQQAEAADEYDRAKADPVAGIFMVQSKESFVKAQAWTPGASKVFSWIFLLHYGGFQAFYVLVFSADRYVSGLDMHAARVPDVAAGALIFLAVHAFSFWRHRDELDFPVTSDYALPKAMFLPYVRIVPIHMAVLMSTGGSLVRFLVMKTLADCAAHVIEHVMRRRMHS